MLTDEEADRLVEAVTEVAGDELRSVVYFTADDFGQLALRDYLSADADIGAFVENERTGFHRIPTHEGSELGQYEYTIRRFEHGYLIRVVDDSHGVFVTTNQLPIERYDDLASTIERKLETIGTEGD